MENRGSLMKVLATLVLLVTMVISVPALAFNSPERAPAGSQVRMVDWERHHYYGPWHRPYAWRHHRYYVRPYRSYVVPYAGGYYAYPYGVPYGYPFYPDSGFSLFFSF